MFPSALRDEAARLLDACRKDGLRIATAESCTGGLIAGLLTEIAGSSDVVERGFVTYSNAAKIEALGVPADLIARHGAVSEPVARAMAEGALGALACGYRRVRHGLRRTGRRQRGQAGGDCVSGRRPQGPRHAPPGVPVRRYRPRQRAPRSRSKRRSRSSGAPLREPRLAVSAAATPPRATSAARRKPHWLRPAGQAAPGTGCATRRRTRLDTCCRRRDPAS